MKIKQHMKMQEGFTLIELLVVMIAFMITGTVIASVIFTHVKAIDKTNTETSIRQTGNSIISQMSKDIRNARKISLKTAPLAPEVDINACTAINYGMLITDPIGDGKKKGYYECNNGSKIIRYVPFDEFSGAREDLADPTSIVVSNCTFTCQVTPGALPVIDINFTLTEKTTSMSIGCCGYPSTWIIYISL